MSRQDSRNMRRHVIIIGLVFIVSALSVGAQSPQEIHGCITNNGSVKILSEGETCHDRHTPITWNQIGPQGPPGEQGPPGLQGPPGPGVDDLGALDGLACSWRGNAGSTLVVLDGIGKIHPYCITPDSTMITMYEDHDGDGFGATEAALPESLTGFAAQGGDCDDGDPSTYPGASDPRIDPDGLDQDCSGTPDDQSTRTYSGPPGTEGVGQCEAGIDGEGEVHPSPEIIDGIDNDCNGLVDDV